MSLAWEATEEEQRHYQRQLRQAGGKRAAGLCVHPQCGNIPARDRVSCNLPECVNFVWNAPPEYRERWYSIAAQVDTDAKTGDDGDTSDCLQTFYAAVLGGATAGILLIGAVALGIWFRWLRILA